MKPSYIKEKIKNKKLPIRLLWVTLFFKKKFYINVFSIGCVYHFLHKFNNIARLFPNSIKIPSFRVPSFGRKY